MGSKPENGGLGDWFPWSPMEARYAMPPMVFGIGDSDGRISV